MFFLPTPPVVKTRSSHIDTVAYPLREYPSVSTPPPSYQSAARDNYKYPRPLTCTSRYFFCFIVPGTIFTVVLVAAFARGLPHMVTPYFRSSSCTNACITTTAVVTDTLRPSGGFQALGASSEHVLTKRMEAGQMDKMMLYVLAGGFAIALVVGITTSWVLQRKQFVYQTKLKGSEKKERVWRAKVGQAV